MNGNRGQYTSAPLHNMKKRRNITPPPAAPAEQEQPSFQPAGKRYFLLSLIVCLGLPLFFLAALIIPSNPLRLAFLAAVAVSVAAMWLLKAFAKSARGTLSLVYGALALVIGLALFMNSQNPESRNVSAQQRPDPAASFTDTDPAAYGSVLSNYTTPAPEENANAAAAAAAVSAAQKQLEAFMQAWAVGNVPQMLEYVLPSWKSQQPSPDTALWNLMLDNHPNEYIIENVLGSDGDTTRTIVVKVAMTEITGTQVVKRMQVLMFRNGQNWYVDPQSLSGTVVNETMDQAVSVDRPVIGSTIAPTASPAPKTATSGITLYYNKAGKGKYYHSSATCDAVSEQWWPLTSFSYDALNSAEYSKLLPCPKCNPPARQIN